MVYTVYSFPAENQHVLSLRLVGPRTFSRGSGSACIISPKMMLEQVAVDLPFAEVPSNK